MEATSTQRKLPILGWADVGIIAVGQNAIGIVAAGVWNSFGIAALSLLNAMGLVSFGPINAMGLVANRRRQRHRGRCHSWSERHGGHSRRGRGQQQRAEDVVDPVLTQPNAYVSSRGSLVSGNGLRFQLPAGLGKVIFRLEAHPEFGVTPADAFQGQRHDGGYTALAVKQSGSTLSSWLTLNL